jgi:hypothetical protein
MATKNKTTATAQGVTEFVNSFVDNADKKADAFRLIDLMHEWSGFEPQMWGPTIIGFGKYHYRYESGREGDAPLIGFSPRKVEFSLYVFEPTPENELLLDKLGKYKMGKACIYAKKLADLDVETLEKLCKATIQHLQTKYE